MNSAGHAHHHASNERRLGAAALITGLFMVCEVVGGVISGSLALIADAGHMLTDFASLVLAWFAFRLQRKPADWKRTYGFDRFQILVAFANGLTLFAIAAWIVVESIERLGAGGVIDGPIMLVVGAAGLVVNLVAFWLLHGADRENLNVQGAALHVLGDLLGSIAAMIGAAVIIFWGWMAIDPILSLLVAAIIVRGGIRVLRRSGHILLEGAPPGVDSREIGPYLEANVPGVRRVSHLHIWSITQERPMATLEVAVEPGRTSSDIIRRVKQAMAEQFAIGHATVEVVAPPAENATRGGAT